MGYVGLQKVVLVPWVVREVMHMPKLTTSVVLLISFSEFVGSFLNLVKISTSAVSCGKEFHELIACGVKKEVMLEFACYASFSKC